MPMGLYLTSQKVEQEDQDAENRRKGVKFQARSRTPDIWLEEIPETENWKHKGGNYQRDNIKNFLEPKNTERQMSDGS